MGQHHEHAQALLAAGNDEAGVICDLVSRGLKRGNAEAIVWSVQNGTMQQRSAADRARALKRSGQGRHSSTARPPATITIQLPEELASALTYTAARHKVRRSIVAARIIAWALDDGIVDEIVKGGAK